MAGRLAGTAAEMVVAAAAVAIVVEAARAVMEADSTLRVAVDTVVVARAGHSVAVVDSIETYDSP